MHFTFLNADRHIPASFEVNGKQFDDAFPVPIAQILIDKEQMHILEIGANKLCIHFADIDMEQDRHEREAQIVKALTPFSDRFSYLMGNRAK